MTIEIRAYREHSKASEKYADVTFTYDGTEYLWSIPIEYRRTGVDYSQSSESEIYEYIEEIYDLCKPENWQAFKEVQTDFWKSKPKAFTTKEFFDVLASDFTWKSVATDLPQNPNWARRTQDLKEFGYTLATDLNRLDQSTGTYCTHLLLLPIPRGGISGYETWSPALRNRIIQVLGSKDVYEDRIKDKSGLIPDHKFPEIRWDNTVRRDSLENLSDDEIRRDFQLISNQRNQQKREACRACFQTDTRPNLYGVEFFVTGEKAWPTSTPRRGKYAEAGCRGCGWYDIQAWRDSINSEIRKDGN